MKNKLLYEALLQAYNVAEGQYSNIPNCCIIAFNNGRTWAAVVNSLADPKDKKRLCDNWDYVPCENCLRDGKSQPLKKGDSDIGEVLLSLMEKAIIQNETNSNN